MKPEQREDMTFVPGIRRRFFGRRFLPRRPWSPRGAFPTRFEIFLHPDGLYHWRLVTARDEVIAESSRGYELKGDCQVAIGLVKLATNDPIWDVGKLDPTKES
ncbi:MAG: DUF1508 domain-containing protein [Chloroflexi bacterium]|nr:DUF1508 domain-containing protein [Chloroflexota bacterium]